MDKTETLLIALLAGSCIGYGIYTFLFAKAPVGRFFYRFWLKGAAAKWFGALWLIAGTYLLCVLFLIQTGTFSKDQLRSCMETQSRQRSSSSRLMNCLVALPFLSLESGTSHEN